MEDLHCLRNIVKKKDYMCKLDLKHAYFSVSLNPASTKFFRLFGEVKFTSFFAFDLD